MNISANGIQFIKENEGFKATVYVDVAGFATIGYGHKLHYAESFPNGVTEYQATAMLLSDVEPVENILNARVPFNCTQNQFDALCDFGYNEGSGRIPVLLGHGWSHVPEQLPRWVYAGGEVVPGLVERRKKEVALFTSS